uniref:Uncharacterized protein n=1 Tax=Octopus bimaculoides TaxID=37653 RepID=A0A0L8IFJ2_OCTBM
MIQCITCNIYTYPRNPLSTFWNFPSLTLLSFKILLNFYMLPDFRISDKGL